MKMGKKQSTPFDSAAHQLASQRPPTGAAVKNQGFPAAMNLYAWGVSSHGRK
jgi:hypothetical protein